MTKFRSIVIHDDTYEALKKFGVVTESFNDVIWKLINNAVSGQTLAGNDQTAAAPQSTAVRGAADRSNG